LTPREKVTSAMEVPEFTEGAAGASGFAMCKVPHARALNLATNRSQSSSKCERSLPAPILASVDSVRALHAKKGKRFEELRHAESDRSFH
jgi:hypothetical protein